MKFKITESSDERIKIYPYLARGKFEMCQDCLFYVTGPDVGIEIGNNDKCISYLDEDSVIPLIGEVTLEIS